MEDNKQPLDSFEKKPTKKSTKPAPKKDTLEQKVEDLSSTFNANQIASMLMIQKSKVLEILNK